MLTRISTGVGYHPCFCTFIFMIPIALKLHFFLNICSNKCFIALQQCGYLETVAKANKIFGVLETAAKHDQQFAIIMFKIVAMLIGLICNRMVSCGNQDLIV